MTAGGFFFLTCRLKKIERDFIGKLKNGAKDEMFTRSSHIFRI